MRPLSNFAPRSAVVAPLSAIGALFLLGIAPAAHAVTATVNGGSTYQFGLAACEAGDSVDLTYTLSGTAYSNPVVSAFSTDSSTCTVPTTSADGNTYSIADQTATTGTISISLPGLLLGTACSAADKTSASPGIVYLCVTVTANAVVEETASVEVEFATVPPDPPLESTIVVESGDQQLHVSWIPADSSVTIQSYDVYCESDSADGGTPFTVGEYSTQVSNTTAVVGTTGSNGKALVNGDSYSIAISATDSYGNVSILSDTSTGHIPYAVDDFYDYYREKGGGALGCASSDGVAWAAVAAALAWAVFRARRSKKGRAGGTALLIGFAIFGASRAANAEDIDYNITDLNTPTVRADRKLFLALEADRYKPAVDSEKDLTTTSSTGVTTVNTPYKDIFGHRVPWRVQGELAWEVTHFRDFGTLLIGGSIGFWQNIGKGIYASCSVPKNCPDAGQVSSDTTLLDIWPMGIEGQWRLDMFTDRYRFFPLIPYVKAGLMAGLWTVYSGNGDIANSPAVSASPGVSARSAGHGQGWTTGYTTAIGGAISLDAIDPSVSNEAYLDLGLQRTSLFAEYGWTRLDGFRSGGVMILSDRGWRFGLSLEF